MRGGRRAHAFARQLYRPVTDQQPSRRKCFIRLAAMAVDAAAACLAGAGDRPS